MSLGRTETPTPARTGFPACSMAWTNSSGRFFTWANTASLCFSPTLPSLTCKSLLTPVIRPDAGSNRAAEVV